MIARDRRAALEIVAVEPRTRGVEAGQGSEVCGVGGDPDRGEHALGEDPAVASQRSPLGAFDRRREIGEQHERCGFMAVGQDAARPGAVERQSGFDLEPGAERGEIGRGFARRRRSNRSGNGGGGSGDAAAPIARTLPDRDIDPRFDPPAQRARRGGTIDFARNFFGPTHAASSTKVDGAVKELAGQECQSEATARRGESNERPRIDGI